MALELRPHRNIESHLLYRIFVDLLVDVGVLYPEGGRCD